MLLRTPLAAIIAAAVAQDTISAPYTSGDDWKHPTSSTVSPPPHPQSLVWPVKPPFQVSAQEATTLTLPRHSTVTTSTTITTINVITPTATPSTSIATTTETTKNTETTTSTEVSTKTKKESITSVTTEQVTTTKKKTRTSVSISVSFTERPATPAPTTVSVTVIPTPAPTSTAEPAQPEPGLPSWAIPVIISLSVLVLLLILSALGFLLWKTGCFGYRVFVHETALPGRRTEEFELQNMGPRAV